MLLGFDARFVPFVEDGSKTHTIRAKRKNTPRAGETCHCYTGLRHKGARLLGRWPCVRVEEIVIAAHELRIDGQVLSRDERNALAWRDGFRGRDPWLEMVEFWEGRLPFEGHIIHWLYESPVQFRAKSRRRKPTKGSQGGQE